MKPKVAFICVHNSCRSQIAEAIAKHKYSDVFEAYSAGTDIKEKINGDAVRIMKKLYNLNMELSQQPKKLVELPQIDVVVTMGCNVNCPYLPCNHREDWNLEDPTGKSDEDFIKVIEKIEAKIADLSYRIKNKKL
ncbi:MAG: arsenate reductase ArsC [Bacilli bacterium]|nr:arsenate reductase ArsC [Bacilli bacterium]MDD4056452.1 arsenate reductase ArsC [Bacilli bacterium]